MAEARIKEAGPGRWTLSGDIGFDDAARLLAAGDAAFGGSASAEVDLSGVGRADSACLALLLEWSLAARGQGRRVRYRNPPASLSALAGLGGVSDFLDSSGGDSGAASGDSSVAPSGADSGSAPAG